MGSRMSFRDTPGLLPDDAAYRPTMATDDPGRPRRNPQVGPAGDAFFRNGCMIKGR
jgi:hypothetical protein